MLTLKNFDQQITGAILQRGRQYFNDGSVTYIEETGDDTWTAEVEGSDTYEVEVTLKKDNEIKDYDCSCPYDGGICKHLIAVFFTLREKLAAEGNRQKEKAAKKDVFGRLLAAVTAEEYRQFVQRYAAKNRQFKTDFELYFSDKDNQIDVEAKYKSLVDKLVRMYTDHGYVGYGAASGLAREVNKLLDTGTDHISKNKFRDAFALAKTVMRQLIDIIGDADDSNGEIGDAIDSSIDLLDEIADAGNATSDMKGQVFAFIERELADKSYNDYGDFGDRLLDVFQALAITLQKEEVYLRFMDRGTGGDDYLREPYQKRKIAFLRKTGKKAEAEKLVQQNMDIVEIREAEVEKAIRKKDFTAAKKLIGEGIRIAEKKKHPGTVDGWKKELLRIAELQKDTPAIREYARYFALDKGFSPEHFRKWKKTFPASEWPTVIEDYVSGTTRKIKKESSSKNPNWWSAQSLPDTLAPLYIEEKYWDRLLVLVQQENKLNITLRYHPYLVQYYPDELLALYLPLLETYGLKTSTRSEYADLVSKMKMVVKGIPKGKEAVLSLARRLRDRFSLQPRRPAMIEELNKILK